MPRTKVQVHVQVTNENGVLRRADKGGRESFRLHYHRTVRKDQQERRVYYVYRDDQRIYLGSALATAIAQVATPTLPIRRAPTVERDARVLETWYSVSPRAQGQAATALTATDDRWPSPSTARRSICRNDWRDDNQAKRRRSSYAAESVRNYGEFVAVVGDKPVNQLRKTDFADFGRYRVKDAIGRTNPDHGNMLRRKAVRAVAAARLRCPDYGTGRRERPRR